MALVRERASLAGATGPGPSSTQQAGTSAGIWKGTTRLSVKRILISPSLLSSLLVILLFLEEKVTTERRKKTHRG